MDRASKLRELIERPGTTILPGVFDAVSAKLVEQIGFEVVFTSGFGISGTTLGMPDMGLLTMTETLERVRKIVGAVDLPLVADVDTGYGNPLNVMRTVRECVEMGVAGIILEDQEWPKKCGHFEGKRVIPCDEKIQKVKAAVEARGDKDLVIIGRTDARAPLGLDEAVERGIAYFKAGVDVVFVEAPQSVDELKRISEKIDAPLFANMIEGGKTPFLSRVELEDLGYKLVVYPLSALFAATKAMADVFQKLKDDGTTAGFEPMVSFHEFEEIIGVPRYREIESRFVTGERDAV